MDAARLDGKPLDQLGKVPEAVAYERSMWEVWLSHYSWKVLQQYGMAGNTELVISGVGGKLKDEIDRVAAKFGESGDDWIARYGGPLKAKLDAEADKANRAAHPWVYGTADLVDSLAKRAATP
jgi:hypothetical protein